MFQSLIFAFVVYSVNGEVPTLETCTIGEKWVDNYIVKECYTNPSIKRGVRPIGCSPSNNLASKDMITDGEIYKDKHFQYTCSKSGSTMIYLPTKCIAGDGKIFEPSTKHIDDNDTVWICTQTASGVKLSYKKATGCIYNEKWIGKNKKIVVPLKNKVSPLTGVQYICKVVNGKYQLKVSGCSLPSKIISLYHIGHYDKQNYRCIKKGNTGALELITNGTCTFKGKTYNLGTYWDDEESMQRYTCIYKGTAQIYINDCLLFFPNKTAKNRKLIRLGRNRIIKKNNKYYQCVRGNVKPEFWHVITLNESMISCGMIEGKKRTLYDRWIVNSTEYRCVWGPKVKINNCIYYFPNKTAKNRRLIRLGRKRIIKKNNQYYQCVRDNVKSKFWHVITLNESMISCGMIEGKKRTLYDRWIVNSTEYRCVPGPKVQIANCIYPQNTNSRIRVGSHRKINSTHSIGCKMQDNAAYVYYLDSSGSIDGIGWSGGGGLLTTTSTRIPLTTKTTEKVTEPTTTTVKETEPTTTTAKVTEPTTTTVKETQTQTTTVKVTEPTTTTVKVTEPTTTTVKVTEPLTTTVKETETPTTTVKVTELPTTTAKATEPTTTTVKVTEPTTTTVKVTEPPSTTGASTTTSTTTTQLSSTNKPKPVCKDLDKNCKELSDMCKHKKPELDDDRVYQLTRRALMSVTSASEDDDYSDEWSDSDCSSQHRSCEESGSYESDECHRHHRRCCACENCPHRHHHNKCRHPHTCKNCKLLREAASKFVTMLCPKTCGKCGNDSTENDLDEAAARLVVLFRRY